jgi:pterin-4a-carbinolamine dehydratase
MNSSVEQALIASLDQYAAANNIDSITIEQRLVEVFGKDMNFLEKVAEFDEVFDEHPDFDELREVYFDLLMINFFTSDVNKLEEDYLESREWENIEEETIDRGTELLNLLLYINECHDEDIKPGLEDFLKEFLLVEEDEFQDEFHIYEDLISNQQLAESSVEDICSNADLLDLSEEMEELFVPFMAFFLQPNTSLQVQQELIKYSNNKSFDVAVYTLITNFNKNR